MLFHQLRYRQFKSFYLSYALRFLRCEFPSLPSYHRCVELMPRCAVPLSALFAHLKGRSTGMTIIDSSPIAVCDNLRIPRHRVFESPWNYFQRTDTQAQSNALLFRGHVWQSCPDQRSFGSV